MTTAGERLCGCAIALMVSLVTMIYAVSAAAQDFPSRIVRIIVPFPPGGPNDVLARTIGRRLGERWGQEIVVENKPGASTQIGAELVMRAEPDGHTLMVTSETTGTINPHLYKKIRYDGLTDFTPISGLVTNYQTLAAANAVPARSARELVELAKAKPGALTYATFGLGSSGHLHMENLQRSAGIKLNVVHYSGTGPALNDLIGGHIQLFLTNTSTVVPLAAEGKIKLIGLGAPQRLKYVPELPTLAEGGIEGIDTRGWFGLFGPAHMPSAVVDKINADVQRIMAEASFQEGFLKPAMFEALPGSAAEFSELVRKDWSKWQRIVEASGLRLE